MVSSGIVRNVTRLHRLFFKKNEHLNTRYFQKGVSFSSSSRSNEPDLNPSPNASPVSNQRLDFGDSECSSGTGVNFVMFPTLKTTTPVDLSASRFDDFYGEIEEDGKAVEEDEDDDDGEAEEGDESDGGVDFGVLDLFDRNSIEGSGGEEEMVKMRIRDECDESNHPLVKETSRLISFRHIWNVNLESELKRLLRSLKPLQVSAVIRSQSDMRVAASFFYWADRQWRYRHSPEVYYTMLELLGKTKLHMTSRRIMRLMIRRGIPRRPEDFARLMLPYSRAGKLRSAMRVLKLMQKDGCEPNLSICNTAVNILVVANRIDKACRFMERMNQVGISPNVATFNCLIHGLCGSDRIDEALLMIENDMPSMGCRPDKISYCTIVNFLCKEKKVDEIRKLMERMESNSGLFRDQVMYTTIIHVLAKNGDPDEALVFLRESESRGFPIDKVGFSAIVHSLCQVGRMDDAKVIVAEMYTKGCDPDVVTYSAVVNGYCGIGKIDEARKMIRHMHKHGCKPNTVTYTGLLKGLCKMGNSLEARAMLNSSEDEWWIPNSITYSVVLHGLRREGKIPEACELVMEMIGKGFFPNPTELNQLIHELCRKGDPMAAKKFMEACQSKGCSVNVVNFTTVIQGFCRVNDMESVMSVVDDMYLSNKHPDVVTYTVVVNALGKNGRLTEATALCKKMLHRGILPSEVMYRMIIRRYCEHDRVQELSELLDEMVRMQSCRTAYNQVIETLCRMWKLKEGYKLLGRILRTASPQRDAKTCHRLMKCYLQKGIPLQAARIASRMFRRNMVPDIELCRKVSHRLVGDGQSKEAEKLMVRFVERGLILPEEK